jgi:hypothetical protein
LIENKINFFRNNCKYVLYSGSSLKIEEDAFRHLNDLFLMHLMLISKNIPIKNIILVIDTDILNEIDSKTNNKKTPKFNITFKEFFEKKSNNIIDINKFEKSFVRDKGKDLVFISSGHGSIDGLENSKNNTYITYDYFENNASSENRTILLMSQCLAGAFHHLDTRKNICVIGASEYEYSVSLDFFTLCSLFGENSNSFYQALSFFDGVAINPFLFSFFSASLYSDDLMKYHRNKNLIHIYKYTAASTNKILQKVQRRIDLELSTDSKSKEFRPESTTVIQSPFLLNKNLASCLIF